MDFWNKLNEGAEERCPSVSQDNINKQESDGRSSMNICRTKSSGSLKTHQMVELSQKSDIVPSDNIHIMEQEEGDMRPDQSNHPKFDEQGECTEYPRNVQSVEQQKTSDIFAGNLQGYEQILERLGLLPRNSQTNEQLLQSLGFLSRNAYVNEQLLESPEFVSRSSLLNEQVLGNPDLPRNILASERVRQSQGYSIPRVSEKIQENIGIQRSTKEAQKIVLRIPGREDDIVETVGSIFGSSEEQQERVAQVPGTSKQREEGGDSVPSNAHVEILSEIVKKQHSCPVCGKAFDFKSKLARHLTMHTGERKFVCDICTKGYPTKSALKIHKAIHLEEKPHVCNRCGQGFADKNTLKRHILRHEGQKNYICKVCGKGFTTDSNLAVHSKSHSSDKMHVCSICNKEFLFKQGVRKHMIVHMKEKPFSCELCGKKFSRGDTLSAHQKTHWNPDLTPVVKSYFCTLCNKSFHKQCLLTRHKRYHLSRPFSCSVCGKGFIFKSRLKYHLRRIHSLQDVGSYLNCPSPSEIEVVTVKQEVDLESVKTENINRGSEIDHNEEENNVDIFKSQTVYIDESSKSPKFMDENAVTIKIEVDVDNIKIENEMSEEGIQM